MKMLKQIPLFVQLSFLLAIIGSLILFYNEKGTESLFFNENHNAFFDATFSIITHFGEFPLILIPVLILWRMKGKRALLESVISLSLMAIVVQLLKRVILEDHFRPHLYFSEIHPLRIIADVQPLYHFSFPSGHTATAFCLFAILSFYTQKAALKILFLFCAILIAISRMYLLQHFLSDVVAGILVGSTIAWTIHFYLNHLKSNRSI